MVGMQIYYQVSTTECFVDKYVIFSLGKFADNHTQFLDKTAFYGFGICCGVEDSAWINPSIWRKWLVQPVIQMQIALILSDGSR